MRKGKEKKVNINEEKKKKERTIRSPIINMFCFLFCMSPVFDKYKIKNKLKLICLLEVK